MAIPITFTKEVREPKEVNPRSLLLYGQPKIGKTSICAQLPEHLILDYEDGTRYVTCNSVNIEDAGDVMAINKKIPVIKKVGYRFLIQDTVSALEDYCEILATNRYKQLPVGKSFEGRSVLELPHGGGYYHLRMSLKRHIFDWRGVAKYHIIIAHVQDSELSRDSTRESREEKPKDPQTKKPPIPSIDIDLTGRCKRIVASRVDACGFLYQRKGELRVSFKPHVDINMGARCPHLKGQDFPFDWNKIFLNENL